MRPLDPSDTSSKEGDRNMKLTRQFLQLCLDISVGIILSPDDNNGCTYLLEEGDVFIKELPEGNSLNGKFISIGNNNLPLTVWAIHEGEPIETGFVLSYDSFADSGSFGFLSMLN